MNNWKGICRLVRDPELRFTEGKGTALCNITVAVDTGFGDKKETAFIPVVIWGKSAEATANYTHKGSKIAVSGRISTRSYDAKDGTKRYVTEIIADMYGGIEFLDSKSNGNLGQGFEEIPVEDGGDIPF